MPASDYSRIDAHQHDYLDYIVAGLYAGSHVRDHASLLASDVPRNPYSTSLTSSAATALVERTRRRVLEFFHAPADEYTAVFTMNASGALKHVGECYPFGPGGRFLLTFDNHNSVNGIREFA